MKENQHSKKKKKARIEFSKYESGLTNIKYAMLVQQVHHLPDKHREAPTNKKPKSVVRSEIWKDLFGICYTSNKYTRHETAQFQLVRREKRRSQVQEAKSQATKKIPGKNLQHYCSKAIQRLGQV